MNLQFKASNLKFDGKIKMMEAKEKGKFTLAQTKKQLNKLSTELHSAKKEARVGVAMHYKNVNTWVPALFTDVGSEVNVWNPHDSPDTEHLYDNDEIDGLIFYVINNKEAQAVNHKYMKPKKDQPKIDKSIFNK